MGNEVNYAAAARRHLNDGRLLLGQGRRANAGQLFGFSVECGIKALLLACGVARGADGGVVENNKLRTHLPVLTTRVSTCGHLIPDGPKANSYMAMLTGMQDLNDWKVDHRYWDEAVIPLTSLPAWERLAAEANAKLDQARLDGVL